MYVCVCVVLCFCMCICSDVCVECGAYAWVALSRSGHERRHARAHVTQLKASSLLHTLTNLHTHRLTHTRTQRTFNIPGSERRQWCAFVCVVCCVLCVVCCVLCVCVCLVE